MGPLLCLVFAFLVICTAQSSPCDSMALGPTFPAGGGVCFSVWAPHASQAQVVPQNGATWQATTMASSDGQVWRAFVASAKSGDAFTYLFNGQLVRLDPRAQAIAPGSSNWAYSIVHDPTFDWGSSEQSFRPVALSRAVVYEMHIPSFNPGHGGSPGTFYTAAQKLPYLASLGITHVELMPVATFSRGGLGWGYNPGAPYAPMNSFGGYKGLKSFVKAAHQVGIAVVLDVVWNHMDSTNNILLDYDGYGGSSGNGIYFYEKSGERNTLWGPRPNFGSPFPQQYILDSISMYIEDYHIDGFRWDATVCIRKPGQTCWTNAGNLDSGWRLLQAANSLAANLFTTAEDDQGWPDLVLPVNDTNAGLPGAPGGAGFYSQWGYQGFFYSFFSNLVAPDNSNVNMGQVAQLLSSSSEGVRVLFTENHDMASNQNKGRIPAIVDPGGNPYKPTYWACKKAMLGIAAIVVATPGAPMLLQGQEFLTYATFNFPVPPNLDWNLSSANSGIVSEVRDLLRLRTNALGNSSGLSGSVADVLQVVDTGDEKVAVIHRFDPTSSGPGNHIIAVFNMYENQYSSFGLTNLPVDGTYDVVFNGDLTRYSSLYDNFGASQTTVNVSQGSTSIMLPAYSVIILANRNQKQ